jgi:UDP-N-acetylglucosamine--N-acetylmuramyl-(pentapeptide) pyrophosphoryl-undecaprenol N-acetylglucosamine transferase
MVNNNRFIISGGGTGGHIYPALSIANKIKESFSNSEIKFVGAKGRMEMNIVPRYGYNIEGLWISGLQRSFIN